jgi:hypothetical protein
MPHLLIRPSAMNVPTIPIAAKENIRIQLNIRSEISSIGGRPERVNGGNYTSNHSTGSFCTHTGPSVFIMPNFGSRPIPDGRSMGI